MNRFIVERVVVHSISLSGEEWWEAVSMLSCEKRCEAELCTTCISNSFLLVMDPLLRQLENFRTLASSHDTLRAQVDLIKRIMDDNFLKLNPQKCEVLVFD